MANDLKIDKRIVERNITKGLISRDEFDAHLAGLKDLVDDLDLVALDAEEPEVAPADSAAADPAAAADPIAHVGRATYDAGIIAAAERAVAGRGDGRISQEDAEMLLREVKDGDTYTDIEKNTVAMLRQKFQWTEAADEWFRTEIRSWAASKGASA